ncbi:putative beta-ketoacyl-[acyl-carrier-protein] synthase I [Seiridium unicorne]|uniref:beta-ketoacyl-[acyl-carrier-protein] synthase I n=1 Tax=Seiridium unicorne TaxID=138068 RepID=A0ABR2V5R6_9PEZI
MTIKDSQTGKNAQRTLSDQYLAYNLLVELTAHQFAFPVQWIDTQKELLDGNNNVQRIVEIGPAKILTGMAKKTSEKLVGERDQAQSKAREFLFIGNDDDARNIRFEYENMPEPTLAQAALKDKDGSKTPSTPSTPPESKINTPAVPAVTAAAAAAAAAAPAPASAPVARPPPSGSGAQEVADVDITPTDIILSLVAHKLKRGIDRVPVNDSVRTLCAGKSVLQNEIIGDLSAEFGNLPQGSEELSIEDLGTRLAAAGYSGKPGKTMKKLLERMFSLKMPAGFGQAEVEAHMLARWGIGPKRQMLILCLAITMEPPARLADADQVQEFLALAVAHYEAHAGIFLPERSAGGSDGTDGSGSSGLVQVDAASLEALKKDQTAYLRKQFQVLAKHLNIDVGADVAALSGEELNQLKEKLSGLEAELDDEFLLGIRGVFDPQKQRRYASWWNWVREDIMHLLHSTAAGDNDDGDSLVSSVLSADRLNSLVSRWNPTIEKILQRYSENSTGIAQRIASSLLDHHRTLVETEQGLAVPAYRYSQPAMAPRSSVDEAGQFQYTEVPRGPSGQNDYYSAVSVHQPPYIHLRSRKEGTWHFDAKLSEVYLSALSTGLKSGLRFYAKTALVTGAGPNSIGSHLVRGLLAGGARVIVTTNRTPSSAAPFFAQMYKQSGAPGSELIVLPFNAASAQDCQDLVAHIYDKTKGIGADLDLVIPFAAIPEAGRELHQLDAKSELAHRAMLTNLLRLLGHIRQAKEQSGVPNRPAAVVLPLSPNHGDFGGDGLYSESKLGLETLFNRFSSESWSSYLSIVGAVIGWTRGTGLMNANDIVAHGIEDLGVLTFTAQEMALNILALLSPKVLNLANEGPVYADLSGGLLGFEDLKESISAVRADITSRRRTNKALSEERARHVSVLSSAATPGNKPQAHQEWKRPRSNIRQDMPALLPHAEMTQNMPNLKDMIDFSRTVVVVGFSELGPWGSSRTRWQMESQGQFNQDGFTELAWVMGLIVHGNGLVIDGQPYFGWIDKETKQAVHDADIEAKYGEHILNHTGIRLVTPNGDLHKYDPAAKEFLQEIVLDDDLPQFEASESVAKAFKIRHGDKATISPTSSKPDAPWTVTLAKGTAFHIPKTVPFHQDVAAQLPKGWSPATYGIPEDVVTQVDPVTLYALCCVCEAMYSAGIKDAYELYKHINVAELGNYIGTGTGGLHATRDMYRNRGMEVPANSDVMQEMFLNSIAAWTNMLLLGAAGPIKTPVGACATAVESLDSACEAIQSGRIKAAFVGGVDDFGEEVSYEFDSMKATANAAQERAKGFLPSEASRPTSSSRAGFVEAAGCGVQFVMTAELALKMGLPIRAIVAYTQMSGDGISRSLPAPGRGVLTAARETVAAADSPLADLEYRRARLGDEVAQAKKWHQAQYEGKDSPMPKDGALIDAAAARRINDAQRMWNGDLRLLSPSTSPLRAALGAWGLSIDDVKVASFHGTSTKANDINESQLINDQMQHLGRTGGNPLLVVCQKYLTGHPKGAAAAWQLNGCMQMIESGIVPGNRNADDVDAKLREFEHLVYPSRTLGGVSIKACMLTSFGFGQKGGLVVIVSPRLLFASVAPDQYRKYQEVNVRRQRQIDRAYQLAMMDNAVFSANTKEHSAWVDQGKQDRVAFLEPGAFPA